jgi:hypothetical protein
MSGAFNPTDSEDGGWARTTSSARIGFVGVNDAGAAPVGTGAQGAGVFGLTHCPGGAGVFGANNSREDARGYRHGVGVQGNGPEAGVSGYSDTGVGVRGFSESSLHAAVFGANNGTAFTRGGADRGAGVVGITTMPFAAGVYGVSNATLVWEGRVHGVGVYGAGPEAGLRGHSQSGSGCLVTSETGQGLTVFSTSDVGLFAQGGSFAAVLQGAVVVNPSPSAVANHDINGSLVINEGNLFVNKGDLFLGNADCAEEFDLDGVSTVAPGSVMVLAEGTPEAVRECTMPYDRRVVGIVSGAGRYRPAITLDRRSGAGRRVPLALVGKVYCRVDASFGEIEIGDLLTTSSSVGCAMKATESGAGFGSIVGKALESCREGKGLIRVLVGLG